jgi:hypothetical protein
VPVKLSRTRLEMLFGLEQVMDVQTACAPNHHIIEVRSARDHVMPAQKDAAEAVGLSSTALKQACRKLGIKRYGACLPVIPHPRYQACIPTVPDCTENSQNTICAPLPDVDCIRRWPYTRMMNKIAPAIRGLPVEHVAHTPPPVRNVSNTPRGTPPSAKAVLVSANAHMASLALPRCAAVPFPSSARGSLCARESALASPAPPPVPTTDLVNKQLCVTTSFDRVASSAASSASTAPGQSPRANPMSILSRRASRAETDDFEHLFYGFDSSDVLPHSDASSVANPTAGASIECSAPLAPLFDTDATAGIPKEP